MSNETHDTYYSGVQIASNSVLLSHWEVWSHFPPLESKLASVTCLTERMQRKWAVLPSPDPTEPGLPVQSLGALTFRMLLLKAELSRTEKPKAPKEASCRLRTTKSGPSPQFTSSHLLPAMWLHHSRWIDIKFGEVCYVAIGNWTHLTCRTSDYHVRSTVEIIQKHLVNHKVFQECKGSLLILWVPALPFLSQPKEWLLARVLCHGNFVIWLYACALGFSRWAL